MHVLHKDDWQLNHQRQTELHCDCKSCHPGVCCIIGILLSGASILEERFNLCSQDFALQEAAPGCSWNHFHFTYQDLNIHALHLQASATKDTRDARNDKPPTDASSLQTPGGSSSQDVVIDVLGSEPESGKPNLLLIHGTGSSSAAWIPIMQRLAETFNILAVDLPGFGRSDGPTSLRSSSREETIDFYCDFLQTYLQEAGLSQVGAGLCDMTVSRAAFKLALSCCSWDFDSTKYLQPET